MDSMEKLETIWAIRKDISIKKTKSKMKKYWIFLISILIFSGLIIGFQTLTPLLFLSVPATFVDVLLLFFSKEELKMLKKGDSYKDFCESYEVLKSEREIVYKVLTKEGETIYLNNDNSKNSDDAKNLDDAKNSDNKTMEITDKLTPQYYILSEEKQELNLAVGREKELELLEECLLMESVNPLIIGPSGCGKTALVKGFIYKLQNGQLCESFKNQKIGEVTSTTLVSGCKYVGSFEHKMKEFVEYARENNIIFFIDEFHTLMGLGQGEHSNLDGANILKPYLSDGSIKIIGATTEEEYEKIIKNDPAFERRFEVIRLNEPTGKMLYDIVNAHVSNYENKYNIKFARSDIEKKIILESLIELTEEKNKHRRYDSSKNNPTLILGIIERAFIKAKRNNHNIVTIENICDTIRVNQNLYESSINNTVDNLNKLSLDKDEKEDGKQKIIKLPNRLV